MNTLIKKSLKTLFLPLALFLAVGAFAFGAPKVTPGQVYEIKEVKLASKNQMTDFVFTDDDGTERTLKEYTLGKNVFLNFWGTWCGPCRREIPDIVKLQTELKDEILVIGIALERDQTLAASKKKVVDFSKNQSLNYINFVASPTVTANLVKTYGGINAVPTTYLVNKNNEIAEKIVGGRTKAQFQESIDKMKE